MRTLYKDGKECVADNTQIDLMVKAGWSTEKVEAKTAEPEEKVEETEVKTTPKKVTKRKPIVKKTTSKE